MNRTSLLGRLVAPAVIAAIFLVGAGAPDALACPMCRQANESTGDVRPKAYMYSILFMLAVPATVLAGFGVGFYRLSRRLPRDWDEEWMVGDDPAESPRQER